MGYTKINENIKSLFTKLFLDRSLAEGFSECKTFDEFYKFCTDIEKGYTKEELIDAIDTLGTLDFSSVLEQEKANELEDENLENISGGISIDTVKKSIAGLLSLLTLGTSGFFAKQNVNAADYVTDISKTGKRVKSKSNKMSKRLKYVLTAAGLFLLIYTAKNFSRRLIVPNKVIGLSNPGNACYINASLQQLYSISEFRIKIMRDNSGDKKIEALKTIFKSLDEGKPLDEAKRDEVLAILGYRGTQQSAYDFMTRDIYIGDVCKKIGFPINATPFDLSQYNSLEDYFKNDANYESSSILRNQVIIPFSQRPSDAGKKGFKAPKEIDILGSKKHLTGAIIKTGSALSGHYISYKKMADGNWYYFSDNYVAFATENEVNRDISRKATALVYNS